MTSGWSAPRAQAPVRTTCHLPGSKSLTARALVLASLAAEPSQLSGVLACRDTDLMVGALRRLGVMIDLYPGDGVNHRAVVHPPTGLRTSDQTVDCGLAGTVMRFVPPLAALAGGRTRFDGDRAARRRPMSGIVSGLRQLGCQVSADLLPFTLIPSDTLGAEIAIDAHESSQFVSAFLLAAPRYPKGLRLRHTGRDLPSRPHIDMTITMLAARGVAVNQIGQDEWLVSPSRVEALDEQIEPDLTNAAVFLAAGILSRGSLGVAAWPVHTTQAGQQIRQILTAMGADVSLVNGVLTARWTGPLRAGRFDLHDASELTPVVAALCLFAEGVSEITGISHIRGHETDRLHALAQEIGSLGGRSEELPDGLAIHGVGEDEARLRPSRPLRSYGDHRIAHFAALVGLRVGSIRVDDMDAVAKTMPDFPRYWAKLFERES